MSLESAALTRKERRALLTTESGTPTENIGSTEPTEQTTETPRETSTPSTGTLSLPVLPGRKSIALPAPRTEPQPVVSETTSDTAVPSDIQRLLDEQVSQLDHDQLIEQMWAAAEQRKAAQDAADALVHRKLSKRNARVRRIKRFLKVCGLIFAVLAAAGFTPGIVLGG